MLIRWIPICFVAAAILFGIADTAVLYHRLPHRIASHFDAQGHADGWSTKQEFVAVAAATVAFVVALFIGVLFVIRIVPFNSINLPNKKYWMAPEREAQTRRYIENWTLTFAAITLWLLVLIFHDGLAANLRQPTHLEFAWYFLGAYFLVVIVLLIQLIRRFWRTPQAK
ncbi:MAG TPA: DUF1648 domain-containing protein [Lacipirellulaceae bacterium]|nr:DUF1648 domain-containing protein [Lacipirellulaceae bacterium]